MADAEYFRNRRKERRKRFLALLGGKCVNCGSKDNLHFDHINANKKNFYISRNLNRTDDSIVPEIKKCQLLCEECHKKKTKENGDFADKPARHGTLHMYKKYKCRCNKCRKCVSDYYFKLKNNQL